MNVGREYMGRDPEVGDWHDLQVRLTGSALNGLQEIFLNDWFFATQRKVATDAYFRAARDSTHAPVLFVESGPDSDRKPFLKSVLLLCGFARESIDLFTPYFVPTAELVAAFQIAAARGVRVRLMVSEKNDHQFLVKIGRSYYETLMAFGVEIYEYAEAVHHAKVIIADGRWLMVGSANLDARSIDLNFELNILLRSPETCAKLTETYNPMFETSQRVDLETFRQRPQRQKMAEGLSRLWAPLL
jgi:cardiolipin synthase A/B